MRDGGELTTSGAESDPALAELTEEITRRLQSGETVDVDAFVKSHPQCAGSLRELLPTMNDLIELGKAVSPNRKFTPRPDSFPIPNMKDI